MLDQHVGTSWTNMSYKFVVPTCLTNERIDYGRIYSYAEISVECWSYLLYQLVGQKLNFAVGVNSAIVDSFACQTYWYMLVQVGTTSSPNLLYQPVDPTFHSEFAPLRRNSILHQQVGTTCWPHLCNNVVPTCWYNFPLTVLCCNNMLIQHSIMNLHPKLNF